MAIQTFTSGQTLTAAQMTSLQANDYNQTVSTKTASYTLVAADVGTHIQMNSASNTTVTVNTSLFAAGDSLFISNIGAGTCTVTSGTCTVSTASSLALAQYGGGTLRFQSASAATFFSGGVPTWGTATGGIGAPTSITISGVNYQYLTFNATGTLTVTRSGFFDYCAIGGGGGAMQILASYGAGGGGGAQVVIGSVYLSANQTITIGSGSPFFVFNTTALSQGGNTSIAATSPFTQTAIGNLASSYGTGGSGAYLGGGVGNGNSFTSALQTESTVTGYRGGDSTAQSNGGGGGGQSGRGGAGSGTTGGTGGTGFDVSVFIGGSALYKAQGGGGGGSVTGGTAATGGVAGSATTTPPNGGANTGQGGGGGYGVLTTGNGGSGICYIRWKV